MRRTSKTVSRRRPVAMRRAASKRKTATRAVTKRAAPGLSNEETGRLLRTLKDAGSVELKLSVPAEGHRAAARSIGLDPVEAQPRQAYFFDTADLALNSAGLIVRARRFQGGKGDTVIKLRPVDPSKVDAKLRRSDSFKVELDAMPGGYVCSASFKGTCSGDDINEAVAGTVPLRSLFSKEQLAYYDRHAPKGITMDKLVPLGPLLLLKAKHRAKELGRNVVVELWIYPDGSHVLEISTKCEPDEGFKVAAEFKSYLTDRGIDLGAEQESKTRIALAYFKARLDAGLPVG